MAVDGPDNNIEDDMGEEADADWDGKCMNCGEDELEGGSDGGKCMYCGSTTIPPQLESLNQSAPPSLAASIEVEPLVTAQGGADTGDNASPWGNSPREIQKRAIAARTAAIPGNAVDIWARELRKVMVMDDLNRKFLVADEHGVREYVVTAEMIDAALPELLKYEPGFSEPRERLIAIIGAALCATPRS